MTMKLPVDMQLYLNAFESGELPPEEQVELFQFLLDTDLHLDLEGPDYNPNLYIDMAEYYIAEGLCYFVPTT